jgi:hypothetical protein
VTSVADTALSLAELVAPATMTGVLAAALGPGPGLVLEVEVLEHKPGRRALLRYETEGSGTVFAKAFPDPAQARRTHEQMEQIGPAVADDELTSPRPLGLVADLALVLYEPLRGPSLDELAGTDAMAGALAAAGRWVTALHRSDLVLDRVLDLEREAVNAGTWGAHVVSVFPDLAPVAARLAAAVADAVPGPAAVTVPIHKDFHYQHVVVGDRVGVVDMDEARMGDRWFDIGHFLANLDLLAHRTGTSAEERDRWRSTFADSCGVVTGGDDRLRWYVAYTCLKLAKQLTSGTGPRPRPAGHARRRQVAWVLDHGLGVLA